MLTQWRRFLAWLGVRSSCCNAKIKTEWSWDRDYCTKCGKRLR